MRNACLVVVLLLAVVFTSLAEGRQGSQLTPEQRKAILDYNIDLPRANHLITALDAMTKYLISLPDFRDRMMKSMGMTAEERAAQMEKDPKAMSILKQNSLTARDYLVGVPALRMALMAAQGATGPTVTASPANIAFAKANLAELKPKMDAADGMRARR